MSPRRVPPVRPGPIQVPGTRRGDRTASAILPEGVQSAPGTRAQGRQPKAYVPFADGQPQPDSTVGVVGVCMMIVGVQVLVVPLSTGGLVFGILFTAAGLLVVGCWVRVWLLWRAAWGAGRKWRWR